MGLWVGGSRGSRVPEFEIDRGAAGSERVVRRNYWLVG